MIGNGKEIEDAPALSVWLGRWNQPVALEPFHAVLERTSEGPSLLGLPDDLVGAAATDSAVLLLGDPYTFPIDQFLSRMNENNPGLPVLGGMASGVAVRGNVVCWSTAMYGEKERPASCCKVRSVCGRLCRRVVGRLVGTCSSRGGGEHHSGTGRQIADAAPARTLAEPRPPRSKPIAARIAHWPGHQRVQRHFQRGDFWCETLGLDRDSGALAITERLRVGQTVQFHVRDAATADEDLHALLQLDLAHEKRPARRWCLAATAAALGCSISRITTPARSRGGGRYTFGRLLRQGEFGPIGGKTSSTASRPAWPCSRNRIYKPTRKRGSWANSLACAVGWYANRLPSRGTPSPPPPPALTLAAIA